MKKASKHWERSARSNFSYVDWRKWNNWRWLQENMKSSKPHLPSKNSTGSARRSSSSCRIHDPDHSYHQINGVSLTIFHCCQTGGHHVKITICHGLSLGTPKSSTWELQRGGSLQPSGHEALGSNVVRDMGMDRMEAIVLVDMILLNIVDMEIGI